MSKRTYSQYCGVAKALDVLGERWTLLIIRELLLGPLRYRDIAAQLPDMATDMLTARLRTLAEHGLIDRIETGGVGGGITYELTPAGHAVRPVVEALARVGLTFMATPLATTDDIALRWALASVRTWLDPKACPRGTCQIVTPDQAFELANDGTDVDLRYTAQSSTPGSVSFVGPERQLVAVLTGHLPIDATTVRSSGDKRQAKQWLEAIVAAFPAPIRA
jgi:DNA-binding HxlR family transcriptional regulator